MTPEALAAATAAMKPHYDMWVSDGGTMMARCKECGKRLWARYTNELTKAMFFRANDHTWYWHKRGK